MSAPTGNKFAAKAKVWSAAIERALERRHPQGRAAALDELAEKLLTLCDQGDLQALKELGDRTDGKPSQAVDLGSDPERPMIQKIINEIVKPNHPDG